MSDDLVIEKSAFGIKHDPEWWERKFSVRAGRSLRRFFLDSR